jgi:hypothetical protein
MEIEEELMELKEIIKNYISPKEIKLQKRMKIIQLLSNFF